MTKKLSLTILMFVLTGVIAATAFAQVQTMPATQKVEMTATVTKMQGEVVVVRAGQSGAAPLKIGDTLHTGDKIEAKDNGKAEITIANGNTINLTPNSHIFLSSLTSDPATGDYENILESKMGMIRFHVAAKIKGKSVFQVKTPTSICGVKGTVFYIMVTPTETKVFVTDGSVNFSNPTTGDTFVVVENTTSISSATGVSNPVELTGADKEAVLAAYEASLSTGSDNPTTGQGVPQGPSQTNSPQTPTDNPPPSGS